MVKIRQMVEIGKQSISCTETAPLKMPRMWAFLHFFPYFSIQFFIKPHNLMISWLFSPNWGFTLITPTIQRFMCSLYKTYTKGASTLLAKVLESNYLWLQGKDIPDFWTSPPSSSSSSSSSWLSSPLLREPKLLEDQNMIWLLFFPFLYFNISFNCK